jgi:transcriptional regulator with GAF, ATPase, and Fis domain
VILIGGVLLGSPGAFTLAALSTFMVGLAMFFAHGAPLSVQDWVPGITVAVNFGLVAVAAWLGQRSIIRSLTSAETSQTLLSTRSAQLQAAAEIGTATATSRDLNTLLRAITEVIAERFAFYHVAMLVPDVISQELEFIAISEGGRKEGKRMSLASSISDGRGIIAHVARTERAYLARDVKSDSLYLHNPQFNEARSEVAVPIMAGGYLFGIWTCLAIMKTSLAKMK